MKDQVTNNHNFGNTQKHVRGYKSSSVLVVK
jgi:hypothetical protein